MKRANQLIAAVVNDKGLPKFNTEICVPSSSSAFNEVVVNLKRRNFSKEEMSSISGLVTQYSLFKLEDDGNDVSIEPVAYGLREKRTLLTVNRSPHGHKKARDQFHLVRTGMGLSGLRRRCRGIASSQDKCKERHVARDALLLHLLHNPAVEKGADVKIVLTGGYTRG